MRVVKTTLILMLLTTGFALHAQKITTNTIRWNSVSTFNAASGEKNMENTTVTSYTDHIEWSAADGSLKYSVKILETNGSWPNISTNGQIIYEIDNQGKGGTV